MYSELTFRHYIQILLTLSVFHQNVKVQSINVNEEGWPIDKDDEDIWNAWKAQGYTLSPMGRIYDSRTVDYIVSKEIIGTKEMSFVIMKMIYF